MYEKTNGNTSGVVDLLAIANNKGVATGNLQEIMYYLVFEGFIARSGYDDSGVVNYKAQLTHNGKEIIEFIVTNQEEHTFNFPSFKSMGL